MRKLLTTAVMLTAPMMLVACGQKAEEAAPVEEVATEVVEEPSAMEPAATDAAATPATEEATPPADDKAAAEPDDKTGPPER